MRAEKQNHVILSGLSHLLRHAEKWPAAFKWDFSYRATCAIGLAEQALGVDLEALLPPSVFYPVFVRAETKPRVPVLFFFSRERYMWEVGPHHVADQIDAYLKEQACAG